MDLWAGAEQRLYHYLLPVGYFIPSLSFPSDVVNREMNRTCNPAHIPKSRPSRTGGTASGWRPHCYLPVLATFELLQNDDYSGPFTPAKCLPKGELTDPEALAIE